jgi:beta-glucanase (GH16 family)
MLKYLTLGLFFILNLNNQVLCQTTCVEQTLNFNTQTNEGYTVDYNSANVVQSSGVLTLKLTKETGGTRVTLNNKLRYGSVSARLKVAPGSNIVSSFILMADNGDEIDFEFVGKDDHVIQTNFFYKGIPIYDKNAKFYALKNQKLSKSFNVFTINWTPEYYEWKFNDFTLRKLFKNNTVNFPDTISNVQFGIWRANPSNWAGWGVDWSKGPFEYKIDWIKVTCNLAKKNSNQNENLSLEDEETIDRNIKNNSTSSNSTKTKSTNSTSINSTKRKSINITSTNSTSTNSTSTNSTKTKSTNTPNKDTTIQTPETNNGKSSYSNFDILFLILVSLFYN